MLRPFLRTLALGLAVLCVADLAIAGWSAWRTIQVIRSWPAVEAEVVESRSSRRGDRDPGSRYSTARSTARSVGCAT